MNICYNILLLWDVFFSPSELTNTDVCFTLQFSLAVHSLINIRTAVHVVLYASSVWPVRRPYLYTMTGCNCIFSPYKFFYRFLVRDISSKIQSSCCYMSWSSETCMSCLQAFVFCNYLQGNKPHSSELPVKCFL
jgi:hypothetical protein